MSSGNLSYRANYADDREYVSELNSSLKSANLEPEFNKNEPVKHSFDDTRYDKMTYRKCGNSGLQLPAISLGLWHNFGSVDNMKNGAAMLETAFNLGITHFDLANNYGPLPGSAEANFKAHMSALFSHHRDELIISSKAGYLMWPGPYGEWGSMKYVMASCDQSLKRTGLDYFDIFYSHRFSPNVPLEETMLALKRIVDQGKALYVGISSYNAAQTNEAAAIAKEMRLPLVIHQPNYSMFDRWVEDAPTGEGLLNATDSNGMGNIVFAPLSQGMLTNKYLNGIPGDSRAAKATGHLTADSVTPERINQIKALNEVASSRGQSLSQMALAWVLRDNRVTSALIGASKPEQIIDNVGALNNLAFSEDELHLIDQILGQNNAWDGASSPWHKR